MSQTYNQRCRITDCTGLINLKMTQEGYWKGTCDKCGTRYSMMGDAKQKAAEKMRKR